MMDGDGNLATSSEKIKEIALKSYIKRLEHRPMKEDLQELKSLKEKLFKLKMKQAQNIKTEPWSKNKIINILKKLKTGKSRDPMGFANEIFHPTVAGDDLINAIVILMNRIKDPEMMEHNINI